MSDEKPGTEDSEHLTPRSESSAREREHAGDSPDLSLDVPQLNIDELELEVQNLLARVSLSAEVADFVKINVGVDIRVDEVKLAIKGVEARALLEVKMERVLETLNRALEAIDNNPQVLDGSAREPRTRRDAGEDPAPTAGNTEENNGVANVTGAARQEAERLSVDLSSVIGTGSNGRILTKDVQKAAKNRD